MSKHKDIKTIRYKGNVVFEKISSPYFKRIPKLYQNNEACFMFINDGEFSVRTPEHFLSFSQDYALLAKCFDYFFETSAKQRESSSRIDIIGILIHQEIVEEIFEFDTASYPYQVAYNAKKVEVGKLLNNFKNSIDILLENPELADESIIKAKLKEFILLINKTENAPSHLHFLSALFRKNDIEFRTTINNNVYSNLSIEELSRLCGMSISSFKRTFNKHFKESPAGYILKRKLKKAAILLQSSDLRISDVAYDCGFDSLATFNRNFKSYFGASPSEYRMNQID